MSYLFALPPVVQLASVCLLGIYVAISIAGRMTPRLRGIWREQEKTSTLDHILTYTVVPALVWIVLTVLVVIGWNLDHGWLGHWTPEEILRGPGALLGSFAILVGLIFLMPVIDLSDAKRVIAWVPFLAVLSAIAMMMLGILSTMDLLPQKLPPLDQRIQLWDTAWMLHESAVDGGLVFRFSQRFLTMLASACLFLLISSFALGRSSSQSLRSWSKPLLFFALVCVFALQGMYRDVLHFEGDRLRQEIGFPWAPRQKVLLLHDVDQIGVWSQGGRSGFVLYNHDRLHQTYRLNTIENLARDRLLEEFVRLGIEVTATSRPDPTMSD